MTLPSSFYMTRSCLKEVMIRCSTSIVYFSILDSCMWIYEMASDWKMALKSLHIGSYGYHGLLQQVARTILASVHLLTKLCADFPKHLSYIATHNRTVNVEGKPGRGKPIDQMTEHYILHVYVLTSYQHAYMYDV